MFSERQVRVIFVFVSYYLFFFWLGGPGNQKEDAAAALPSWAPLSPARGRWAARRQLQRPSQPGGSTHASPLATTTRARTQNNLSRIFPFAKSSLHTRRKLRSGTDREKDIEREREREEGGEGEGERRCAAPPPRLRSPSSLPSPAQPPRGRRPRARARGGARRRSSTPSDPAAPSSGSSRPRLSR